MENIIQNIERIKERIHISCLKNNRNSNEVKLLLATKTVPVDRIRIALQSGQTLIAENKVQELKNKYETLKKHPHTNHFIGHLQSNKIKDIIKHDISCIQSLDRLDLAKKLHQRLEFENKTIDALIQINTSNEESKFGIHPDKAIEFILEVAKFHRIRIKGLMTIGLLSQDSKKVRDCFRLLKQIQERIKAIKIPNVEMKELSMGMSGDFEIAIEEGATIIRIGSAIFGPRSTPDSYYWNETKFG